MAEYKIEAISPQVRDYPTKFGDMKSYSLKLSGMDTAVELSQKATSKPPTVGDVLNGTIDQSGQYGPKFKKDFGGGSAGFGTTGGSGGFAPKNTKDDPFTMFLSYAKDLVVALVETKGFDQKSYEELLSATLRGGKALYNGRPGAQASQTTTETTVTDKELVDSWVDQGEKLDINNLPLDDFFKESK